MLYYWTNCTDFYTSVTNALPCDARFANRGQQGTPFQSIHSAQAANEDHVFITPSAVQFIKSKLVSTSCN
jgi:hypothetical protein